MLKITIHPSASSVTRRQQKDNGNDKEKYKDSQQHGGNMLPIIKHAIHPSTSVHLLFIGNKKRKTKTKTKTASYLAIYSGL